MDGTRRLRNSLLIIAAFLVASCAALTQFLDSAFQRPSFTFKDVSLSNLSLNGLTLDTVWQLQNPNPIGLSLATADYRLSVEGKQVLAGSPPNGLNIPAQGSQDLHFPASFKLLEIFPALSDLATKDVARYKVEGTVGINTPIGVLNFPLAYENQFEVPKIPQVQFQPPKVTSLNLRGATVEFPLAIANRNSFSLPIEGVSGALRISGVSVGNVSTGNVGALEGKATKVITMPVTIDLLSAASGLVRALQGGTAPVEFHAALNSGGRSVPVDLNQVLNFIR